MDLCGKVMSLLFNMLSRLVIAFLSRSKCLLISWLQSSSAVILEPKKIKSVTVSIFSPSICHEVMGPDAMIFGFWMLSFKPPFVYISTCFEFFGLYIRSGSSRSCGHFRFNFLRNHCFPQQLNHFTFPPAMFEHSIFLHPKTQHSKN